MMFNRLAAFGGNGIGNSTGEASAEHLNTLNPPHPYLSAPRFLPFLHAINQNLVTEFSLRLGFFTHPVHENR
jgi:hypothetical protein